MLAFLGVIVPGSLGIYVPTYPQVRGGGREGGREGRRQESEEYEGKSDMWL